MGSENQPNFESAVEQLQKIVKSLESGDLSLEDSLKAFEDGVRLTRACQDQLKKAEQKVELLLKPNGDGKPGFGEFKPES
jgi:exodeoxyribonuclease VII small subunit